MEKVHISGPTVENSTASGKTTKCMAEDCLSGLMAGPTKANTTMIRKRVMDFSCGRTTGSMTDTGRKVNRKVSEFTLMLRAK